MSAYNAPNDEYIKKRVNDLQIIFTDFVNRHAIGFVTDVKIDIDILGDCVQRVVGMEENYDFSNGARNPFKVKNSGEFMVTVHYSEKSTDKGITSVTQKYTLESIKQELKSQA